MLRQYKLIVAAVLVSGCARLDHPYEAVAPTIQRDASGSISPTAPDGQRDTEADRADPLDTDAGLEANAPDIASPTQPAPTEDDDADGLMNNEDNCRVVENPDQADTDVDGIGDVCDTDRDGDSAPNDADNCPDVSNDEQSDTDGDGIGDACDDDLDNDGALNNQDNCPGQRNADQADMDRDGLGDRCDDDLDNDGAENSDDNCLDTANSTQADLDNDGIGDACDPDIDDDNLANDVDNCPAIDNPNQADMDGDRAGDVCDEDIDGDEIPNVADNCPSLPNRDQADRDLDNVGDLCDDDADGDDVHDAVDNCPNIRNRDQLDTDVVTWIAAMDFAERPRPEGAANRVILGDDQVTLGIDIGFPYSFDGVARRELYISSNGFVRFAANERDELGSFSFAGGGVSPYFSDLDPSRGGAILYWRTGEAPNRSIVVMFDAVPAYGGLGSVTSQIVLRESGDAELICINCGGDRLANAFQGAYFDSSGENPIRDLQEGPYWGLSTFGRSNFAGQIGPETARVYAISDGFGDRCDVCPSVQDPNQADANGDGIGDACAIIGRLDPFIGYGAHGVCGQWNNCQNAEGCARAACQANGFETASSWVATTCGQFPGRCDIFSDFPDELEEDWLPRDGCDLPIVSDVVCTSRDAP